MWLATVAWAVGEIVVRRSGRTEAARLAWTLGVALALVHAGLAFHYVHGWSHSAAALETMQQAEARFGVGWSGGVYVNYVFLAIWGLDTCWWWLSAESRSTRSRGLEATRWAFFVFMFVNGAVVFASGVGRAVGIACVAAVLLDRVAASQRRPRLNPRRT